MTLYFLNADSLIPRLFPRAPHRLWLSLLLLFSAGGAGAEVAVVLNSGDHSVSLIDTQTYKEIERRPIGKEPHHLMATPDDRYLIVANAGGNDLVFLDPKTGATQHRLPSISDPYQIGFSPDRRWFVVASLRLDRVDIYHAQDFKLAKRIALPKWPSHISFNRDSSMVFVTLQDSNQVAAIELATQTVKWVIPVGPTPAGIWTTPDDRYLLVGIMGADYAEVIDWRAAKTHSRIATASGAHNFLPMGDGRHVLISNRVANSVSIIDQQSLRTVTTFAVPGGPDCLELRHDGKELWVTSRWARRVTVIDMTTKKIIHSIPVGRSPHGIYFFSHAPRI